MTSSSDATKSTTNGLFSFDRDGFNVDGIYRIGGQSLREMLFPEECSGKRARKRARDRAEDTITIPWLVAHLTFYDIDFQHKLTVAELRQLLADNVKQGKVSRRPAYGFEFL